MSRNPELFSDAQIVELRERYGKFEGIDPLSPSYKRIIAMLDSMPQEVLKQIEGANIKFLSSLARNRVKS